MASAVVLVAVLVAGTEAVRGQSALDGFDPNANGKIAFSSLPDYFESTFQIYAIDSNGSNLIQLTFPLKDPVDDQEPSWSPDGTKIAFTRSPRPLFPPTVATYIFVMNANGSNKICLTGGAALDSGPTWSPDGTKIAFTSRRDGNDEIYVMDANGANQIRLTNNPANDFDPAWSPDGTKIAFTSGRDSSFNGEIYVMDANGSNQTRLTNNPAVDDSPAWSPDGTKIAFTSSRDGNAEIYVMDANGSNQTNLTNNPAADVVPAWSPDGAKIAFTSSRDGNGEIYVMDANGSNQTNLTNNTGLDTQPDWQRMPAAQAVNLSTRMRVQTGDNVGIGGFIITGTALKHVLLRAIGPSLVQFGVLDALADPVLELHGPGTFVTITNDNWRDDPVQEAAILATGIPPSNDLESAIDATLVPGAYTAIVSGNGNTSGVALVEVYDLSQAVLAKLLNTSTRAFVSTGDNIVIAGFTLGGNSGNDRIVVRGIGPSLTAYGVANALADPTLELRDSNGALLVANNDWQDDPAQAAELTAAGLAPTNQLESGIARTLPPGLYTALLAGLNNSTGIGLVEVYDRGGP